MTRTQMLCPSSGTCATLSRAVAIGFPPGWSIRSSSLPNPPARLSRRRYRVWCLAMPVCSSRAPWRQTIRGRSLPSPRIPSRNLLRWWKRQWRCDHGLLPPAHEVFMSLVSRCPRRGGLDICGRCVPCFYTHSILFASLYCRQSSSPRLSIPSSLLSGVLLSRSLYSAR